MITYEIGYCFEREYHYVYLEGEKVGFIVLDYTNDDKCYYYLEGASDFIYETNTLDEMKEILEN